MNPHIELVKKWLADNESVSLKELRVNMDDAYRAYCAGYRDAYWDAYWAAYWAAY